MYFLRSPNNITYMYMVSGLTVCHWTTKWYIFSMKKTFFPVLSFLQLPLVLCVWLKNCGLFFIHVMDIGMSIGIILAQLMPEHSCWWDIMGAAFDVILVGCYGCSFWYYWETHFTANSLIHWLLSFWLSCTFSGSRFWVTENITDKAGIRFLFSQCFICPECVRTMKFYGIFQGNDLIKIT